VLALIRSDRSQLFSTRYRLGWTWRVLRLSISTSDEAAISWHASASPSNHGNS
jgi:hypothetical protein